MPPLMILPDAPWRHRPGLDTLVAALGSGGARFVGGAVRDTLLGRDVQDIDIATPLPPPEVIDRLTAVGIKTVPTGIAHGTVTAVLPDGPVEITTLRRDVSTDGRRAIVAFSDDWREDAARRDFTVNALYADPVTGEIFDPFGGLDDLQAGRVRFIGDPAARIAEDHLRILRFFRFHARFGAGAPDEAGLAACESRAKDLMALSRERIADELTKLLALPDPAPTVRQMQARGIFLPVLPEIDAAAVARLESLVALESEAGIAPDAQRRLIALLPPEPRAADGVATRLRASKALRKRIATAVTADGAGPAEILYRWGLGSALDRLLLSQAPVEEVLPALRAIEEMERPVLPIGGGALVARGLKAGPLVAQALHAVERRWIDEGFPDAARLRVIADEVVAASLAG